MFHQNIDGTKVQSSTKYFVIVGLVLLMVGMGYSVYLYKKAISPPVIPGGMASQQERKAVVRESGDCTYARPCPPALTVTTVPGKSRVCFDPPVFANLKGFGLIVSSGGGSEHRYECTLDDVVNGICKEKPIETFRFAPDEGVIPPRHWFTNDVGQVC